VNQNAQHNRSISKKAVLTYHDTQEAMASNKMSPGRSHAQNKKMISSQKLTTRNDDTNYKINQSGYRGNYASSV